MRHEFNFQELKSNDRLPSPSGTALAIIRLTQRDDTTIRAVAELVQTDPALSSRIIRFANSPAISPRRPVISIQEAVILLGMKAVRQFALSLSVISRHQQGPCKNFDYDAYWSNALARAIAIQSITGLERTTSPEEAFSLGLLCDIGRLALATAWPEAYSECLESRQGEHLLQSELERFAIDHQSLSLLLLAEWGFPAVFLDALKQSHDQEEKDDSRAGRFARQLGFAECVARYCQGDEGYRQERAHEMAAWGKRHGLQVEELDAFLQSQEQQWRDWGQLVNIATQTRLSSPPPDPAISDFDPPLPRVDVLFVGEKSPLATALILELTASGYQVNAFHDPEQALQDFLERMPDLVIIHCDQENIEASGICKTLVEASSGKLCYLILLSAKTDEETLVNALEGGVDAFLSWPVSMRTLKAHVQVAERFIRVKRELEVKHADIGRFTGELSVANRRLQVMANTDLLTGLPNRRYALSRLEQEWAATKRYRRPLCALILDLDHFKQVNDNLGHDMGDKVLVHVTQIMRGSVRATDILCRLGGEEFLVIAPNTDRSAAIILGERIRKAVEEQQPQDITLTQPVTVSIGISAPLDSDSGWQALIKRADQAMYRVKRSGRNGMQFAAT